MAVPSRLLQFAAPLLGLDERPRAKEGLTAADVSFIVATREPSVALVERLARFLPAGSELVLSSVPGGAAHARNVGARFARGKVFVFMDDDIALSAKRWDWEAWLAREWDFAVAQVYWPAPSADCLAMRLEATALNVLTGVVRYKLFMSGFGAIRREAFESAGGYNTRVTWEEPAMTLKLYSLGFRGGRLPVRVSVLRRWDSWRPFNDTTSRGKLHPEPKEGEIRRYRMNGRNPEALA